MTQMHRMWIFILGTLFLSASAIANESKFPSDQRIPFALTISGGVSLGAYESGSNWAFLRYLKQNKSAFIRNEQEVFYDLVAVTGASAGSINSLISAIYWCMDEKKAKDIGLFDDSATGNLFYEAWGNVGLDALLPDRKHKEDYRDNPLDENRDGLLARKAFDEIISKIKVVLAASVFEEKCEIPLGLTVTAEKTRKVHVSGLAVENQRQFIPVLLKTDKNGMASLYSKPVNRFDPNFGSTIYLPPIPPFKSNSLEYPLNVEHVINAVLASSAFPVAFGRIVLDYCAYGDSESSSNRKPGFSCPHGFSAHTGTFVDGGVFDNIPLGATMALAEENEQKVNRRVNYIYIDPDQRRNIRAREKNHSDVKREAVRYDLGSQLGFLSGSITTARKYELFKVLSGRDWDSQLTSKFNYLVSIIDTPHIRYMKTSSIDELREQVAKNLASYEHSLQFEKINRFEVETKKSQIVKQLHDLVAELQKLEQKELTEFELEKFSRTLDHLATDPFSDRRLFLSSRFALISGEYLGAFAAFFSQDFRDYDYYLGVYDAIIQMTQSTCDLRPGCKNSSREFHKLLSEITISVIGNEQQSDVHYMVKLLLAHERGEKIFSTLAASGLQDTNSQLYAVACSLIGEDPVNVYSKKTCDKIVNLPMGFSELLKNLNIYGYNANKNIEQKFLAYAVAEGDSWWRLPAYRASHRLNELEKNNPKANGDATSMRQPLNLISSILCDVGSESSFKFLLPNEAGFGISNQVSGWPNRAYLAWNIDCVSGIRIPNISLRLVPYQRFTGEDRSAVGNVGFTFWIPGTGENLGVGGDLSFRWIDDAEQVYSRVGLGANIQINIKPFSTRITAGLRSIKTKDVVPEESRAYFNVGYYF